MNMNISISDNNESCLHFVDFALVSSTVANLCLVWSLVQD